MDPLEKAESLDAMDRDVTSWEADFLEKVLVRLRAGGSLTPKQLKSLDGMYEKYFGVKDEDEGDSEKEFDSGSDYNDSGTAD